MLRFELFITNTKEMKGTETRRINYNYLETDSKQKILKTVNIKSQKMKKWSSVFFHNLVLMESIVLLTACFLAALVACNAQFNFNLPFDSNERTLGKLLDPLLAQALKSKYPKKYSSKFGFQKDVVLDSKHRLGAEKLLTRHLKNLNAVNQDLQKLCQQHLLMQPLTVANQALLSPHQQYLSNTQNQFDARRRFSLCPTDGQMSTLLQASSQHFQQPTYPWNPSGIQSVTSLRPQQTLY